MDARSAATDTLTVSVTAAVHGSEKAAGPLCKVVIPLVSSKRHLIVQSVVWRWLSKQ